MLPIPILGSAPAAMSEYCAGNAEMVHLQRQDYSKHGSDLKLLQPGAAHAKATLLGGTNCDVLSAWSH